MKLYENSGYMLQIRDMFYSGEIDENTYEDAMNACLNDREHIADYLGGVIKELSGDAELIKKEEERLAKRRKALENGVERIKMSLRRNMEFTGEKKIEGKLFTFSCTPGKEKIPDDLPISMVPEAYIKHGEDSIKKSDLLKAIKDGKVDLPLVRGESIITMR